MQESNVRQAFMLTEKRLCAKLTIQSYIFFGFNCYKKEQWNYLEPAIEIKPYVHEQIYYDKGFDRVRGWTNFLWQMSSFVCPQWLLDSETASTLGG